jgi:hypothetical protein
MPNTQLSDLRTMLRTLVDDLPVYFNDEVTGTGTDRQWAFTHKNILVDEYGKIDKVEFNSVENTGDYTIDSNRGWITFAVNNIPADNVQVVLQYRYYESFSDTEIDNYLTAAIGKVYLKGYATWTITSGEISTELTIGEQMLVCSIAALIIDPAVNISWSTGEMSYSSRQYGVGGEQLIDKLINQAKMLGAKINDFYVNVAGINNDTNLQGDEIDYDV